MAGSDLHLYRNTASGAIAELTEDQASVFASYLQLVTEDQKPLEPGTFTPGTVDEIVYDEPQTDAQLEAQAELDAALEEGSSRTKAAREAKAELDAANEAAIAKPVITTQAPNITNLREAE